MCILIFGRLIALYIFFSLVRNANFLIVKTVVSEKKSVMSTNYCTRTSCWWVFACAPHFWFWHLPNWHFSLHLPTPSTPWHISGRQFPTLDIQEKVKQKSTFFTFILRTIYKINGTSRYFERCWPATNNDSILALCLIDTHSLTLSAFYRDSTTPIYNIPVGKLYRVDEFLPISPPLILLLLLLPLSPCFDPCSLCKMRHDPSLHPSTHPLIDPYINPSIDPSIHPSVNPSIDQLINWSIDQSIYKSFDPSNHWSIDQYIDQSINPLVNTSIDLSINPSIHQFIDHLIDPSIHTFIHSPINQSIDLSIDRSIHLSSYPSIHLSIYP